MSVTLRVARSPVGGLLASLAVRWPPLRRLLRLEVLGESPSFVAFTHPRPQYPSHVLIVSTKGVRDFLVLDDAGFPEVLALADELARDGEAELVTNLGRYQEVRLLHFHLLYREQPAGVNGPRQRPDFPALQADAARQVRTGGAARVLLRRASDGSWRREDRD